MANFVDLTTWIPVDDAKAMIKDLIEKGTYQKHQIKKSSNLFANKKDKSDGYVCRVLAEEGVCPSLELPKKEKKTRAKKVSQKAVEITEAAPVDNRRYIVKAELINDKEGLFLVDQSGKFWVEKQYTGTNEKEVVSGVVNSEEEARDLWLHTLSKYK